MPVIFIAIVCLVILCNVLACILFGVDKRRAELGRWRVPERTLWLMCAPGAALGGLIGMRVFHHKTHKPAFKWGMPILLFAQLAIAAAIMLWNAGLIG